MIFRSSARVLAALFVSAAAARAQERDSLPFACGERLTFGIRAFKFGTIGHAVMEVSGPDTIRGVPTLRFTMETKMGVLFLQRADDNRSYMDPLRMASVRFERHQRGPFSNFDEIVDIFPDLHFWSGMHGEFGNIADAAPLDELAFIYFLRTVWPVQDSLYAFGRHYDRRRIPSTVRFMKRETLRTPAGEFKTEELEVRVKDGPGWKGEWVIHLWISEDRCRLPVRMETEASILGSGAMILESAVTPACGGVAAGNQRAPGANRR